MASSEAYPHAMKALTMLLITPAVLAGFAPVAGADSSADYLSSLDKAQISYSDPIAAVSTGNSVCQQLHSNTDFTNAVATAVNAGYGGTQAGKILYIASHTLCPDMGPAVEKWANTP